MAHPHNECVKAPLARLLGGSQAMAAQTNFKRGQKSQLANQVAHSGVSTTTASPGREKHIIRSIRKCFYHIPFFLIHFDQ